MPGVEGKPTQDMLLSTTYSDVGWDFIGETANGTDDIWQVGSLMYPVFSNGADVLPEGVGTISEPYEIWHAHQIVTMSNLPSCWDAHFVMSRDIDMSRHPFTKAPIAPDTDNNDYFQGTAFTGSFDGNGYAIENLSLNSTRDGLGLFGGIGSTGRVSNLGLINANVKGWHSVGILAGHNMGLIENCYSTGTVSSTSYNCGGLVGYNLNGGTVQRSCSSAHVTSWGNAGGLVGINKNSAIVQDCYTTEDISGSEDDIGGLIGDNKSGCIVRRCYTLGFATCTNGSAGAIAGVNDGSVINAYWNLHTGGPANNGGTGLTYEQMSQQATFTGWDFTGETANGTEDIWKMPVLGMYPILSWQDEPTPKLQGSGDFNDPYIISTVEDLLEAGASPNLWDRDFILTANLDLDGLTLTHGIFALPKSNIYVKKFTGSFDGQNHTIKNMTILNNTGYGLGFFGGLGEASIRNLYLENVDIRGKMYLGGLAGTASQSLIENCTVSGIVFSDNNSDWDWVGGLVGFSESNTISNCTSICSVIGYGAIGGLIGQDDESTISQCSVQGDIAGKYYVGGFCGFSMMTQLNECSFVGVVSGRAGGQNIGGLLGESSGNVANCYVHGYVFGETNTEYLGGLIGRVLSGTLTHCYAGQLYIKSSEADNPFLGGLVGWYGIYPNPPIAACFWNQSTSTATNISLCGVGNDDPDLNCTYFGDYAISVTSEEMADPNTFIEAGWDFAGESVNGTNDYWYMPEGNNSLPLLRWQND